MSNTLESLKAAVEVHKMRDAILRRQGAEEFRARAVAEMEKLADEWDDVPPHRIKSHEAAVEVSASASALRKAAAALAALPLEPEREGEKP